MRERFFVIALALFIVLTLCGVATAEVIDCGAGDVQCLISAINQANADPHTTTIRLAGGTYALTSIDNQMNGPNGLPSIVTPLTIDGGRNGATLTRSSDAPDFRLLHVGPTGRLVLTGIGFVEGREVSFGSILDGSGGAILNDRGAVSIAFGSFENNLAIDAGGAIYTNQGTITITDSTFTSNLTGHGGAGLFNAGGHVSITRTVFEGQDSLGAALVSVRGDTRIADSRFINNLSLFEAGGVFVRGGTASIVRTTFENNLSQAAGGILVDDDGVLTVRDTAFVDNGGEIGGGLFNRSGTVTVINATFARNRMGLGGSRVGIAAANAGTMTIINSTFAENRILASPPSPASVIGTLGDGLTRLENTVLVHSSIDEDVQDCSGVVISLGNNLITDPTPCNMAIQLTDLTGAGAGLADLTDDGTPGNAHYPLLPDSQAIDAANSAACPSKDQIGRPRTAHCDIGSIEFRQRFSHQFSEDE